MPLHMPVHGELEKKGPYNAQDVLTSKINTIRYYLILLYLQLRILHSPQTPGAGEKDGTVIGAAPASSFPLSASSRASRWPPRLQPHLQVELCSNSGPGLCLRRVYWRKEPSAPRLVAGALFRYPICVLQSLAPDSYRSACGQKR